MKKFLSIVTAFAITAALAAPMSVFAADHKIGPDDNGEPTPTPVDTKVEFEVEPGYTVTIPSTIELSGEYGENYKGTAEITATDVQIAPDKNVCVSMTAAFKLDITGSSEQLAYGAYVGASTSGDKITSDTVFTKFASKAGTQTTALYFETDTPPVYAGEYSETVQFNISVK